MIKITIIVMVFNESQYLEQTMQSIQEQNIKDYEVLIGDNASTDGSSKIIEKLAEQDNRIVHIMRPENIGALQNWNDLIRRAKGEYIILAGGHDLWSANYLRELAFALDNNASAVLSFAKTQWINNDGSEIHVPTSLLDTSSMSRIGRFVSLMFANQHYLYGMIRADAVRSTRLQKEIIGSGEIFLQELAQLGDFVLVDNERWYRRINRSKENGLDRLDRYSRILFSSPWRRLQFKIFPHIQMMFCYMALPFVMKNVSMANRFHFVITYPIIVARFIKSFFVDMLWLIKT